MHRGVLEACLPGLATLAVLAVLLWCLIRLSRARLNLRRLRELHGCQEGGVQSLAFVITLPIFLMIVLFIVQVSQLMVGIIAVNYAAFAAARSSAVWVPALVRDADFVVIDADGNGIPEDDSQNVLPPGISPGQELTLTHRTVRQSGSAKYSEIFHAAALACASIAPSRAQSGTDMGSLGSTRADEVTVDMYNRLVPSSSSNTVMPQRLRNKLAYSLQNTEVVLSFVDKNSATGPTYNPLNHDFAGSGDPQYEYDPSEVGWQDPVTVEVRHYFALIPGPGRFLSKLVVRYDGRTDEVAPRIERRGDTYSTLITASATMTVEGLKSVRPYVQEDW